MYGCHTNTISTQEMHRAKPALIRVESEGAEAPTFLMVDKQTNQYLIYMHVSISPCNELRAE